LPWNSDAYDADFFANRPCCKYSCSLGSYTYLNGGATKTVTNAFDVATTTAFDSSYPNHPKRSNAEIFLFRSVIGFWNDKCKPFETGDETLYSSYALGYTFLVWVVVFFCIF